MATATAGAPPAERRGFRRDVGLVGLTFTSLGCVIGSGWLLGALSAAQKAGPASLLSWVLAGFIVLALGLVYAELGAAYPVTGGLAQVPRLAFGPLAGFTSGWVAWLGSVTLAPIEVEAALQYLTPKVSWVQLTHGSAGSVVLTTPGYAVAAVLMLLFTIVNVLGVRRLSESNTVAVVWKTAIPVLTVGTLLVVSFHGSNFTNGAAGGFAPFGAKGILAALPAGVVFALTGFEQAVQLGGESRNPGRDMPRAVVGSVLIGVALYFLLEVAFLGAISPSAILHGWADPIPKGDFGPFATLATGLGLGWLAVLLYTDAVISPGGTGLVYVGTSSRASYALARHGSLPAALGRVDRRGVPVVSIGLSFVVGLVMFLPFPGWQQLVTFISSASALMFSFAPLALVALRRNDPDRERPYRTPVVRVLAPASFAAAALIVYWSGWNVVWKLMVALLLGYGLLAVAHIRSRRAAAGDAAAQAPGMPGEPVDWRSLLWLGPYLVGLAVLSALGQFDGAKVLPFGVDMVVVIVFALVIFAVAPRFAAPPERVRRALTAFDAADG
jgi:amino acid transporter